MTPEVIAGIVGFIVSLVLAYLPKLGKFDLKAWYDGLAVSQKKLVAAGIGLVVALAAVGASCLDIGPTKYFTCSTAGLLDAFMAWWAYFLVNQTTYAVVVNKGESK